MRRIPLGSLVRKIVRDKIFCTCRQANNRSQAMIQCDNCCKWFHKDSVGLDTNISYNTIHWICGSCETLLKKTQGRVMLKHYVWTLHTHKINSAMYCLLYIISLNKHMYTADHNNVLTSGLQMHGFQYQVPTLIGQGFRVSAKLIGQDSSIDTL